MTMPAPVRRWWITVPVILVALLLGTFGVLAAVRSVGVADLAAVKADLRRAGEIEDYATWRNQPLPGDPTASDALAAALRAFADENILDPFGKAFGGTGSSTTAATARTALPAILARQATGAAVLHAALGVPGAVFNSRHRLPTDPVAAAKLVVSSPDLATNLLVARAYAQHLASRARLEADPVALADLRRLVRAMAASDLLIDAMVMVSIQGICDQTHLALAREGRLTGQALDAWLLDGVDPMPVVDRALTTERCAFGGLLFEIMAEDGSLVTDSGIVTLGPFNAPYWWAVADGDGAHLIRGLHQYQIAARTGTGSLPIVNPTGLDRWTRMLSSIVLPNLGESLTVTLRAEAHVRANRAAALLIRDGGSPAAIAPLLDRGPTRIRLGYEALGGKRVRIAVDLSKPQPGLAAADRFRSDRCIGAPAQVTPALTDNEGIEFDLP